MLETSSSCSSTNHASVFRVVWSFSVIAWSIKPLICLVTVSSRSSDSLTASSAARKPARDRRYRRDGDLAAGVDDVLDEAHRVLALLLRLPVEVAGQRRQRLAVEVGGDRHVLEHRRELVTDLLVDGVVHLGADQHDRPSFSRPSATRRFIPSYRSIVLLALDPGDPDIAGGRRRRAERDLVLGHVPYPGHARDVSRCADIDAADLLVGVEPILGMINWALHPIDGYASMLSPTVSATARCSTNQP